MITSLKPNQIFVFGSNLNGWHAGGAARQAKELFGAIEGIGHGFQGNSYALPTLDEKMQPLSLEKINHYLRHLGLDAKLEPKKEFLLTPVGTGICGYSLQEIKSILPKFPPNVKLVGDWE